MAKKISKNEAAAYIHGYGLGLDLTDRKFQSELKQNKLPWLLAKSFKGSAVVSSFVPNEIGEEFWLKVNGDVRQNGNIADMIFSIPEQISYLSRMIPLMKGDLIFTGTPMGVGEIHSGDDLNLGIGGKTVFSLKVK